MTSTLVKAYLGENSADQRIGILQKTARSGELFSLSLIQDLLTLDLTQSEKIALIGRLDAAEDMAIEEWLTRHLIVWPQALSSAALRYWAVSTKRQLWHRLVPLFKLPLVPQRIRYTILDTSISFAPHLFTPMAVELEGLEEFSRAFHGLLLTRALQISYNSTRLRDLAKNVLSANRTSDQLDQKADIPSLAYLVRFGYTKDIHLPQGIDGLSLNLVSAMQEAPTFNKKSLAKFTKLAQSKTFPRENFLSQWPPLWHRHLLPTDWITTILSAPFFTGTQLDFDSAWQLLGGIPLDKIVEASLSITSITGKKQLQDCLQHYCLIEGSVSEDTFPEEIWNERKIFLGPNAPVPTPDSKLPAATLVPPASNTETDVWRKEFFQVALRQMPASLTANPQTDEDIWQTLTLAWQKPAQIELKKLTNLSRKLPGPWRLCYILCLGKYQGNDEAVLKLLDFIRTPDETEIRAVAGSLMSIGTTRSLQELIAMLTRTNVTAPVKLDIVQFLRSKNLDALQADLRAAVRDLPAASSPTDPLWEIREALAQLIHPQEEIATPPMTQDASPTAGKLSDEELDRRLGNKIPYYKELSSDVRRSLRTAEFFHMSSTDAAVSSSMDLSPLIDMQYKALELFFRESFEHSCHQVIQQGIIQRRLDVIGYARPIPTSMDEFENYIANLPIINTVPFFSKFKLRKMLRALCQFESGKRFTLDGLKAFGLFFLCFGRQECRYGLSQIIQLGFASDEELTQFTKELHVFQDLRNRAAHEGFHPEARNDLDGLWQATAMIVQGAVRIRNKLNQMPTPTASRTREPEIQFRHKKVS